MKFLDRFRSSPRPESVGSQESPDRSGKPDPAEKQKSFLDFGMEALEAAQLTSEEKEEIARSLGRKERNGLRGAEHITDHEAEIFMGALRKLGRPPVEVIDLAAVEHPYDELMKIKERYLGVAEHGDPPVLFLLRCDPEKLERQDPDFRFDNATRSLLQHNHWVVFLTGDMRFADYSGSMAVNFLTSRLKGIEDRRKRLEKRGS